MKVECIVNDVRLEGKLGAVADCDPLLRIILVLCMN
jgi:hypothetical protein